MNIQNSYAKALIIDLDALGAAQKQNDTIACNKILMDAFNTDVEPLIASARLEMGLDDVDPIRNYRNSGWAAKIASEREDDGINTLGG